MILVRVKTLCSILWLINSMKVYSANSNLKGITPYCSLPFNRNAYHAGYAYEKLGVDEIIQPQRIGLSGEFRREFMDYPYPRYD